MSPRPDFAAHRREFLKQLQPNEALLLFGGPHHLRNGDAEFRYRPHSDVYWLTGWEHPEVAIFLRPGDEPFTLFCQPKDAERETWTGFRPGPEGAIADFGADRAFTFATLEEELPRLLQGVSTLHYAFAVDPDHDALLMAAIHKAKRASRRNGLDIPETFHSPSRILHELRLIKRTEELDLLRRAATATEDAHRRAMSLTAPGVNERDIEAMINWTFRTHGGNGPGYTPIVAGGSNGCVLHYITNDKELRDGDLLLVDAGCEVGFYTADVTRTWPVNGTFTEPQRQVYQAVLSAQKASIDACRPGSTFNDVHDASVRGLTEKMVELGLLEGEVDQLIHTKAYRRWYMHGTSHWLGLDVHDVGAYGRLGESRVLEPGMVLTVEPGLYIRPDDETAPQELRGLAVRIEDDILVTEGEPEILTAGIPTTIEEVEAACREPIDLAPQVRDTGAGQKS